VRFLSENKFKGSIRESEFRALSFVVANKKQVLELVEDQDHVGEERDAFPALLDHHVVLNGLPHEEDADAALMSSDCHCLDCRDLALNPELLWRLVFVYRLERLRVDDASEIGNQIQPIEVQHAQPATLREPWSADVRCHTKVVLSRVQKHTLDLHLLLLDNLQEVTIKTVDHEATQLLNEGLADHNYVAVARKLERVDLPEDLGKACYNLHVFVLWLHFVDVH